MQTKFQRKTCLLTGATGFLGKRVLQLLVDDPRVLRIHVVSRQSITHPSPKVQIHQMDLVKPWCAREKISGGKAQNFLRNLDVIIHLAGLYDFTESGEKNYQQNVLPMLNLIDQVRQLKHPGKHAPPQILMASTYAVGFGSKDPLNEAPLTSLPPSYLSYAYTKAVAEKALTDSELSARIFRLGVLVGDSKNGEFEKIDGPYYLMSQLKRLGSKELARRVIEKLGHLPFPYAEKGILPLVPVDRAAEVFHEAVFLPPLPSGKKEIYGVFHSRSVSIPHFAETLFREYLGTCRPKAISNKLTTETIGQVSESVLGFVSPWLPKSLTITGTVKPPQLLVNVVAPQIPRLWNYLERMQCAWTGIPTDAIRFATDPIELENRQFELVFGKNKIPPFEQYQDQFFEGFSQCVTTAST